MDSWKIIFFPFAWLYGIGVRIRHWLFNIGVLKSESFDIPVISVGNISLGGTGKTPFVEYIVRLLVDDYPLATLSRGYGRKSTGFRVADQFSRHQDVGDEPMQYFWKYGNKITVAVDENRREGIHNLIENDESPKVILLDDAFQHRYVKPGFSILLTDFHKLYKEDYLLPVGTLRDTISAVKRADIIIVTKTFRVLSPLTRARIEEILSPTNHQKLFFSYLTYGKLIPLENTSTEELSEKINTVLLFSGIANSYPLQEHLKDICSDLYVIDFRDHHVYQKKDLELIRKKFEEKFTRNKIVVTTEKDAMRLKDSPFLKVFTNIPVYYIPVEVRLHGSDSKEFDTQILTYVRENTRNN